MVFYLHFSPLTVRTFRHLSADYEASKEFILSAMEDADDPQNYMSKIFQFRMDFRAKIQKELKMKSYLNQMLYAASQYLNLKMRVDPQVVAWLCRSMGPEFLDMKAGAVNLKFYFLHFNIYSISCCISLLFCMILFSNQIVV